MDWISVVEAAYALDREPAGWISGVLDACAPVLDAGDGLAACQFRRTEDGFAIERIVTRPAGRATVTIQKIVGSDGARLAAELVFRRGSDFASLSEQLADRADLVECAFRRFTKGRFADGCGGIAHSGDGRALAVGIGLPERRPTDPTIRGRWSQIASHLGAGLRLIEAFAPSGRDRDDDEEAILEPDGRVAHARGLARCDSARDALRAAVRRIDSARTRSGRSDVETALASWEGLVSGRWSLVDRFEADGRRYVVARRNDPNVRDPRGLERREAQVAEYLALGHSEKQISYSLGLSAPSVSRLLRGAMRKLGLRSLAELAALFAGFGRGDSLREVRVAGEPLAVGTRELAPPTALVGLSRAEREVASLACHGRSDVEIARERGASSRTVENQLHAVYRKLGIHSRTELAARLSA
jgi:DNA-binding CsgD family transcriptional regulator